MLVYKGLKNHMNLIHFYSGGKEMDFISKLKGKASITASCYAIKGGVTPQRHNEIWYF